MGAIIRSEADDHAALRRAGDDADDDVVEGDAHLLFLGADFFGEADIAEAAIFVHRGAGRDAVGLAAGVLHRLDRFFPALANADVESIRDDAALGAHQARHHDIADAVVHGVLVRHTGLLDDDALHADLG